MARVDIHPSWLSELKNEFEKTYFNELIAFLKNEKSLGKIIYPPSSLIFNAFNQTPFHKLKVVIIGQDPYHAPDQANGLCFSVKDGVTHPPSLINIFKEIESDLGQQRPKSGNLERWAEQGVLLLNATLTVGAQLPRSHQKKGWEQFTDAVIKKLSEEKEGLIFLLWGGFAKKKASIIDAKKHHILTSGHPSPLSANRGYWFGNKHFSQTNDILNLQEKKPIDWK